jgi:hypothetical protein
LEKTYHGYRDPELPWTTRLLQEIHCGILQDYQANDEATLEGSKVRLDECLRKKLLRVEEEVDHRYRLDLT